MEHIQGFQAGMQQDISKTLFNKDAYYHAENFSLVTRTGSSSGILRNIKGNELKVSIPDCSNIAEVKFNNTASPLDIDIDIVVGTNPPVNISVPYTSTWYSTLSSTINSNSTLASYGIKAQYSEQHVVIYSILDSSNQLITSSFTITNNNSTDFTVDNTYVPAQTNNVIIGWGNIRDSIFLFTTNETQLQHPSSSYGQIWSSL